jgi:hypothetical protein
MLPSRRAHYAPNARGMTLIRLGCYVGSFKYIRRMSARLEQLPSQQARVALNRPAHPLQALLESIRERQLAKQAWKHQGGLSRSERAKLAAWRSKTRAPQLG